MLGDQALASAIADGDEQAYQQAVACHGRAIAVYAWRILADEALAEDIAQETFIRLWTKVSEWQPEKASLSTWLHRIAHNLCVDYLRRAGPTSAVSADDMPHQDDAGQEGQNTDNDPVFQSRLTTQMNQALMSLPERQRSALVLIHYQSLSNRQAAEVIGISVRALESLLVRARQSLKAALDLNENQSVSSGMIKQQRKRQ
jgi:RNA polymerase sigma-70 factor (ECF subfamily)